MGVLEMLLGKDNPAAMWAQQNRGWTSALGAGLGSGATFSEGLANAAQMGPQGQRVDDAYRVAEEQKAERQRAINQTAQYLAQTFPDLAEAVNAGMPLDAAWSEAMKRKQPGYGQQAQADLPASIQEYQFAKDQGFTGSFLDFQTQRGGAAEISLTPTWGIDQDKDSPTFGQRVLGQLGKDNKFHRTDMGGVQPIDPVQMQGDKTGVTVDAKTAAAARAALPGLERAAEIAYDAIDLVTTDEKGLGEQFGNILGVPQRNLPVLPGSSLGNWQANFAQAKGQSFLQAREMLKGGGPITDYEGQKADAAFSRMETAAALGDKENFLLAAKDFKEAIDSGVTKLREVASGGYSAGAPAVGGGTGWKVIGVE